MINYAEKFNKKLIKKRKFTCEYIRQTLIELLQQYREERKKASNTKYIGKNNDANIYMYYFTGCLFRPLFNVAETQLRLKLVDGMMLMNSKTKKHNEPAKDSMLHSLHNERFFYPWKVYEFLKKYSNHPNIGNGELKNLLSAVNNAVKMIELTKSYILKNQYNKGFEDYKNLEFGEFIYDISLYNSACIENKRSNQIYSYSNSNFHECNRDERQYGGIGFGVRFGS